MNSYYLFKRFFRQSGVTLVELLVAMVLGLALIAGVAHIYLGTKQSYRQQENLSRMQESARFALDFISHDTRITGYRGCAGPATRLTNTLNNSADFEWDFRTALQGFSHSSGSWTPAAPPAAIADNAVQNSDVLVLRTMDGNGIRVTQHPAGANNSGPGSANIQVPADHDFEQCDILLITDCESAAVFQITNVASGIALVHNTGAVPACPGGPGNFTKQLGKNYEINGEVIPIVTKAFYVGIGTDGRPGLWMRSGAETLQELVPGVERMRVLYGVRTSLSDELAYRPAAAVGDWDDVVGVRISLLLQSPEDNVVTEPQDYVFPDEDGNPETINPADRRLRQVFTTTVGLRNRLP